VAITSIGLDGEKIDQVTFMDKPRINVKINDLIATAENTLVAFDAEYEIIQKTDIRTAIGNILILRITRAGNALVAGPSGVNGMSRTVEILRNYNPKKILIDGAFFRHSLARISEATVFVVGANFHQEMEKTIQDAMFSVQKFELKKPNFDVNFLNNINQICLIDDNLNIKRLEFDTVIGNTEKIISMANEKYRFLYLPKAITNRFVETLVNSRHRFEIDIILDSPISIQLGFTNSINLFKLSNKLYVIHPINLVAVCFNPYSPRGYEYDNQIFQTKLEKALNRKVYNVEKEN